MYLFIITFSLQRSLICLTKFSLWNQMCWALLTTMICIVCFILHQHSLVAATVWPVIIALSNHYIVILSREVFFVSLSFISMEIKWKYHLQYRHQKAAINATWMYTSVDITVCQLTEDIYFQITETLLILLNYSILSRNF
jgi:hypothetical protein